MTVSQKNLIRKLIKEELNKFDKYPSKKDIIKMLRYNLTSRINFKLLAGYVIGSEAKGTSTEDSDLDIGIIIPKSKYVSSLKRTENYHSKFMSDEQKPKWRDKIVDFQFFYEDDPELKEYNKIQLF